MGNIATILNNTNSVAAVNGHVDTDFSDRVLNVMSNIYMMFDNYWFAVLLVFIIILLLTVFSRNGIPKLTGHLKFTALVIWVMGLGLYMYGFNEGGSANNSFVLFLRASLSSMEMFVSHSDLIEVSKELHHDVAYMVPFALVHFCAVLVSAVFIIRLLGLRFISWMKLVVWRSFRSMIKNKPCFVFFGINRNAILLAKSIKRRFPENSRIIFVNMPDNGKGHGETRFTFSHFFHSAGEGAAKFANDIETMDALLFNAERHVSDIHVNSAGSNDDSTVFDIFNKLGLSIPFIKTLDFLVKNFAEEQKVDFFFLSDSEQENISSVLALKSLDKDNSSAIYRNFRCYCHARKNNINMALLRHGGLKDKIYLVDSSSLSIIQLMKNVKNHPVNFVDIDKETGVAKSGFAGMVIGFSETGCDAFKFIYEFSSFVCDNNGSENPKTIYVVDKNMERMRAEFLTNTPALKGKGKNIIDWWENISTHSLEFWDRLQPIIDKLNYVVITVGNDEEGLSLASDLYEFAYRYRKNLDRFGIFVRLKNEQESDYIHKVSDIIVPFGADRDIFEYDTMSVDVLEKNAVRFYYNYEKNNIRNIKTRDIPENRKELELLKGKKDKTAADENKIKELETTILGLRSEIGRFEKTDCDTGKSDEERMFDLWRHRRDYKLNDSEYIKRDTKEDTIEVWYKEEQDKSNVWHVLTKRALTGYSDIEDILSRPVLLKNLNYCEHLRWNAKMELLGFIPGEKKSFKKRIHHCIVDCKTLSEKFSYTIPFDRAVVELSFSDMTNNEKQD